MAPLVDGPTWVFPMLWANLHVGFYILIGTFLQHGLEDTQQLAPYVARNVHLLQGAEPLRSILIGDKGQSAEVLAWTIPDASGKREENLVDLMSLSVLSSFDKPIKPAKRLIPYLVS